MSSPPTFCLRASRSTMTPFDVERMAIPIPFRMRGMESVGTYRRSPGFETRLISLMAGARSALYLRRMVMAPWGPSSWTTKSLMKPSPLSTSAIRIFSRERGTSTFSWRAAEAFRMRVNMSAMGSVMLIARSPLPARLDDAGDLALQRALAEADAAHLELAQIRPGPAAERATVVLAHLELQ